MKLTFTVAGLRRRDRSHEAVGFKAKAESNDYEIFLEGVSPHRHSTMSLHITEDDLDLFPIDGAVAVTVEPQLASEPSPCQHPQQQPPLSSSHLPLGILVSLPEATPAPAAPPPSQ